MIAKLVEFALVQRVSVCLGGIVLLFGGLYAFHILDIVAYPDPSPPMVEMITQYPGWSSEEIERQITIPIETTLLGMPGLRDVRSLSIFGLSDIRFYFDFSTDYFTDRQEVLNRIAMLTLPANVQPALSPWWAIAEIFRYELVGDGVSLTELKALQDWKLPREFKRVQGVIDVTAFGGTTKEYHVDINPGALLSYEVSLPQVINALTNSNANVGGNYLTVGAQNYNIRGLGLINGLSDIENVMVTEKSGTPVFVKNLGKVSVGHRVRLGTGRQAQEMLASRVQLPEQYRIESAGEYDQLKDEQKRLTVIVPLALLLILFLLYTAFDSALDAFLVLVTVPFALIGGVLSLVVTGTAFSISSAVGVISTLGAAILGGVLLISRIVDFREARVPLREAIIKGADVQMRPILMATLGAAIGLLPAALATGIGSQAQKPLARVVVGGMLTAAVLILVVLPVLYELVHRREATHHEKE